MAKLVKKVKCLEDELDAARKVAYDMRQLKNKMAERRRSAEARAATSGRRLERAQEAEQMLRELQAEYEEVCATMEAQTKEVNEDDCNNSMTRGRRDERGCFEAEPASMRVLKWAQLARNVPTTSINANITEVLRVYAPQALIPQPCERQMRKMRGELTIAGEALSAYYKIGKALRVVSFGFDESTKFGISLLSTNIQIEPHHSPGTLLDVVPSSAKGCCNHCGTHSGKGCSVD